MPQGELRDNPRWQMIRITMAQHWSSDVSIIRQTPTPILTSTPGHRPARVALLKAHTFGRSTPNPLVSRVLLENFIASPDELVRATRLEDARSWC